jgi:hypothetical protein
MRYLLLAIGLIGIASLIGGLALMVQQIYWYLQIPLWVAPTVGTVLAGAGIGMPDTGSPRIDIILLSISLWDAILTFTLGVPVVALAAVLALLQSRRTGSKV